MCAGEASGRPSLVHLLPEVLQADGDDASEHSSVDEAAVAVEE